MAKTALELTPQEWQAYRPDQMSRRLSSPADPEMRLRRRRAWHVARQAAKVLREQFGAQRVVIFGVIHRKTEQRQSPAMKDQLLSKIHDHTAVVAVVGLGYVGLLLRLRSGQALAVAFAEKGFPVTFAAAQCRPFDCAQSLP